MTAALLTLHEVAARIQKSPRWVRDQITAGDLGAHRFGKDYRISEGEFADWLERRRNPVHPIIRGISPRSLARLNREAGGSR